MSAMAVTSTLGQAEAQRNSSTPRAPAPTIPTRTRSLDPSTVCEASVVARPVAMVPMNLRRESILLSYASILADQIEQAQTGQSGRFQQLAFQVLFLQHRELFGRHFAPIRTQLVIELAPRVQQVIVALARASDGDHLVFERGQTALQVFEVAEKAGNVLGQMLYRSSDLFIPILLANLSRVASQIGLQFLDAERRGRFLARAVGFGHSGHGLRLAHDCLGAVSNRVDHLDTASLAAPILERQIDAAQHRFQRHAGILPGFHQRPIERRHQKQPGAARLLKVFFDLGEIIKVIGRPVYFFWFRRHMISRPSSVRSSLISLMKREDAPISRAWPPVAIGLVSLPSSAITRSTMPSIRPTKP